jgi:hypothetical protein
MARMSARLVSAVIEVGGNGRVPWKLRYALAGTGSSNVKLSKHSEPANTLPVSGTRSEAKEIEAVTSD